MHLKYQTLHELRECSIPVRQSNKQERNCLVSGEFYYFSYLLRVQQTYALLYLNIQFEGILNRSNFRQKK